MATIESLRVVLDADTTRLRKGLTQMRQQFLNMRTVMAGVAGATGLGAVVHSALKTADALGKTADNVGLTVRQLQELRHAADLSGGSAEQLDSAMNTFAKRVGEARNNTGALTTFLKKNNEQLLEQIQNAGSMNEALELYANFMQSTSNATDRNAASAAAFTKRNQFMIQLLKDGTAGLDAFAQSAQQNISMISQEQTENAARAIDAVQRMQDAWSSMVDQLALRNAGGIATFLEDIPNIIDDVIFRFQVLGRIVGRELAFLGAITRFDFQGAAEIGSLSNADIVAELRDEEEKRLQEEGNRTLDRIAEGIERGVPAVAQ